VQQLVYTKKLCLEYVAVNIWRIFIDSKIPKIQKCIKNYLNLPSIREEEERVKSEKAKRRNSIGCDKKEIDDSNPVKRLDRQRSRSEGSSKTMSDVNTQAAADSIVVNTSNIASNSDSMMHSTTTSQ